MNPQKIFFILIAFAATNLYAMKTNDHINGDTLVLKGRIAKSDMESKKGEKLEGVIDYYFSSGGNSYFIKTASGKFSKTDLDAFGDKEITIKCVKKFGNVDIDSNDPAYAQTRVGEYILILEVLQQ